jgi:hypothetical protein
MKRSRKIGLLVLGTAALMSGCSNGSSDFDNEVRQQRYASKADCERDWEKERFKDGCTSSGGGYMGPRYYWNHSAGVPVAMMPDGTHRQMTAASASRSSLVSSYKSSVSSRTASVSRGGFGGFGRGSAGG